MNFRVTPEEKQRLRTEARAKGLTVGDYVRVTVLGSDPAPNAYAALAARVDTVETTFDERVRELQRDINRRLGKPSHKNKGRG